MFHTGEMYSVQCTPYDPSFTTLDFDFRAPLSLQKTFQIVFTLEMLVKLIALNKSFFRQKALILEMGITLLTVSELVIVRLADGFDFTGYSLLRLVKLVRTG